MLKDAKIALHLREACSMNRVLLCVPYANRYNKQGTYTVCDL